MCSRVLADIAKHAREALVELGGGDLDSNCTVVRPDHASRRCAPRRAGLPEPVCCPREVAAAHSNAALHCAVSALMALILQRRRHRSRWPPLRSSLFGGLRQRLS